MMTVVLFISFVFLLAINVPISFSLLISSLITHAERHHGDREVVSRRVEGDIHRTTYREMASRSRRTATGWDPTRPARPPARRHGRPHARR